MLEGNLLDSKALNERLEMKSLGHANMTGSTYVRMASNDARIPYEKNYENLPRPINSDLYEVHREKRTTDHNTEIGEVSEVDRMTHNKILKSQYATSKDMTNYMLR